MLSSATIKAAIAFFLLSFGLYLGHIYESKHQATVDAKLPTIAAPALPAPAPAAQPATAQPLTPPPSAPAK